MGFEPAITPCKGIALVHSVPGHLQGGSRAATVSPLGRHIHTHSHNGVLFLDELTGAPSRTRSRDFGNARLSNRQALVRRRYVNIASLGAKSITGSPLPWVTITFHRISFVGCRPYTGTRQLTPT